MSTKWKTPIRCPECGSTAVKKREVVHKTGTSHYSGRSSTRGISFGLSGKLSSRAWLGGGSHSGKRQSIKAQEAEPFPFWPSFLIPTLVLLFKAEGEPYSGWAWFWFALSAIFFLIAFFDFFSYQKEWLCGKCGTKFIPEVLDETAKNRNTERRHDPTNEEDSMIEEKNISVSNHEKKCSICGNSYPNSEFEYGNRKNRSYCQKCNTEEKSAYSLGGKEAARQYREEMRSTWKKA